MRAILLAAGRGVRLRPLTDTVPKCLLPIAGRPLLDYWLEACERHGFSDVLVNTHWLAPAVESYLASCRRALNVRIAREECLLGTAGTLRANWDFVRGEELFLFAHADNFTDLDLGAFVADFRARRRAETAMAAALFRTPTPGTCGIVRLDDAGHVVEFHEKSPHPPGDLANGAVYLGTRTLGDFLALDRPGLATLDFSTQVIPNLMGRILGYRIPGFLEDIGSPETYERWKLGAPSNLEVDAGSSEDYAAAYARELAELLRTMQVTCDGRALSFEQGVRRAVETVQSIRARRAKIMLIGNGASSAIASHQAADFLKAAGVRACAFTDPALLTCLGNDLGYENTFAYPVGMMGEPGDLLIAISSSGASPNILKAAAKAREVGCRVLTLSGFKADNPLRGMGELNFYVDSSSYGKVEVLHLAALHCVNDFLAGR